MSQKERENFYRHSILIVDHTRDGLADLIEVDVLNRYSSFEDFVNQHQHEIYHLCYNRSPCCQCPPGNVLPKNRILHPTQLDLLFDKHGGKLPCHKPARRGDFCCCTAKSGLSLTVLDVTLARCILINFCSEVFWDSCLTKMGLTLEVFLNGNKHDIYHILTGNTPCCQCSAGYKYPVHQKSINQNEWKLLFGLSHSPCTMHPSPSTGALNVCSVSATTGISVNHLTPNLASIILENFCSLRQAVDILIQSRNNIYGHAHEAKISDPDFAAFWSTAENALLKMSKTTSKEPETKQKLVDLKNRCLDEILLEQYKVKILEQIQMENDIHEYMEEVKEKLKEVVEKKTEEIKESILEKIEESNDKILQRMDHVPKKYTEEQEIKRGRIKEYTEARIQVHVDDKTFVSTNADKIAMASIQNTGIVVIVGPPGAGKSRMGLHLMRQYSELHKNYNCFQIDDIMEWKDIVNIDDNCIILCDDIFGVRTNLAAWVKKLECGGDIEKQGHFKKLFIQRLRQSPVAIETDKANEQHYEVPTEFFKTALGKRLKYSCCYWTETTKTLEEAENESLKMYCESAKMSDGLTVLDLGCGWGSLGLYILETYPRCRVTCVSNSNTQRQHIESQALKMGVADRLECITADANYFTTNKRFDRIMSIEMFEHMKNYEILMQRVSSWLKPSGYLFIQILCHKMFPYAFDTRPGADTEWMAKNFFTGGTMPSSDLFLYFQKDVSIVDQWIWNGKNYSKTLEAWLEKTDINIDKVKAIFEKGYGDEADKQLFNWRLFFIFCSEVFGYEDGNEWHVALYLFKKQISSSL